MKGEYKESFIFLIYLFKEEKFQGTHWEYEKEKVNVTQRSPWDSIYVKFSHSNQVGTSLLTL
jgi:hypothetical protein